MKKTILIVKTISIVLSLFILGAGFIQAQEPDIEPSQTHWGFGVGGVANRIPLSLSTFSVLMSQVWYSYTLGDPNADSRFTTTLGAYGFQLILPIPRFSVEYYLGKENQDMQLKAGLGGFYDLVIGGHAGLVTELGIVIANRVDISLFAVPIGIDSVRSYTAYMGLVSEEQAKEDYLRNADPNNFMCESGCHVVLPYYGIYTGLRF